ncbi:MAG: hypothetical protein KatS3mg102_2748 [Planctomycetota bacterium]|nr:MAG: hypothetical protein KatS3mg102_2748 [Planctomycetota bacterium]
MAAQPPAAGAAASGVPGKSRRRRRWPWLLGALLLLAAAAALWYRLPPPAYLPDYRLDLRLPPQGAPAPRGLWAGFAARPITPDPERDGPVWLAGFGSKGRRATGVHDPLWARAVVLGDGRVRIGIVALDLIGHYYTDTIQVRQAARELGLDYVAVCSTHNHNSFDAIGLWGRLPLVSGRSEPLMERTRRAAVAALAEAAAALAPASLVVAQAPSGTESVRRPSGEHGREALFRGWIRDDRPPYVIDERVTVLRLERRVEASPHGAAVAAAGRAPPGATLGTVVIWGNHPEALGPDNCQLTSDYPHFLREHMEAHAGGICVFLVGAVGGLMSPLDVEVTLADGTRTRGPSFRQAEAIGRGVAEVALAALAGPGAVRLEEAPLAVRARTVSWPLANRIFYLAAKLGVIDRGFIPPGQLRSEVAVLRVGPLVLLLVPGEIYPELLLGGIENPPGADFPGTPPEGPPLYELVDAPFKAAVGLANDLVGYIIPKAEWDEAPPYLYGSSRAWYGEINSTGPEAAGAVCGGLRALLEEPW